MKKLLLFMLLIPAVLFAQTQIGDTLEGVSDDDLFGFATSVSQDGSTMAVSGTEENSGTGYVNVYERVGDNLVQIGETINGTDFEGEFGSSIDLSVDGSTLVVGARYAANFAGHAKVYRNIEGEWEQLGDTITGEMANDISGEAVSISADGSIIAIGAWSSDDGSEEFTGHVRIFEDDNGSWSLIDEIRGSNFLEWFGDSLELSADGNRVIVGAPAYEMFNGRASVYENIDGEYVQIGEDILGPLDSDLLGEGVSISADGNVIAIGTLGYDTNSGNEGKVDVYKEVDGAWEQQGQSLIGELFAEELGTEVSLSSDGSVLVAGAPGSDSNVPFGGAVKIFVFDESESIWTQVGNPLEGENIEDLAGSSVSISGDGLTLVFGANQDFQQNGRRGYAKVFDLSDIVLSVSEDKLFNPVIAPNPASDFISVSSYENFGQLEHVSIYDFLGKRVLESTENTIDISKLSTSIYLVRIETSEGSSVQKLIVK